MSVAAIVLVLYFLALLSIGYITSRYIKNLEDFVIAGRRLPTILLVGTTMALCFGGANSLGAAGGAFSRGWIIGYFPSLGQGLALIVIGVFLVSYFKKFDLRTLPEWFYVRYNSALVRALAALTSVFAYLFVVGGQIKGAGTVLSVAVPGINFEILIVIGAVVILIYTYLGGLWAVTLTDFIQILVIGIGVFASLAIGLWQVGGLEGLAANAPPGHLDLSPITSELFVILALAWFIGVIPAAPFYQDIFAAKDEKSAKRGFIIAGILFLILGIAIPTLGVIANVVVPNISPDQAIPALFREFFPPVIGGIFLAAIAAAVMSTADTSIVMISSIFTVDFYMPYFKPNASLEESLKVVRILTLVVTAIGVLIAIYGGGILWIVTVAFNILMVTLLWPLVIGRYWQKANKHGAIASMIGGGLGYLFFQYVYKVPKIPAGLIGLIIGFTLIVVVSILTQESVERSS